MIKSGDYEDRFRQHLSRLLISVEREAHSRAPLLRRQLHELEHEISVLVDELLKVRSQALRQRLILVESKQVSIKRELKALGNIEKAPSQVVNLVNRYMAALRHAAIIIKTRSPGEQKTAIDLFLEKGELRRSEGVVRFYFYDLPQVAASTWEYRVSLVGAGGENRTLTGAKPTGF